MSIIELCYVKALLMVVLRDKVQSLVRPRPLVRSYVTGCLDVWIILIVNRAPIYNTGLM